MMAEPLIEKPPIEELLAQLYRDLPQTPLQKMRARAWERFREIGLPTRKTEAYRYLRMRNFYSRNFRPDGGIDVSREAVAAAIYPECARAVIVLVNGRYRADLSDTSALPKKMVVQPLDEAFKTYSAFITNQWTRSIKEESDPFAALNAALYDEALFLYVPPKVVVDVPLQILNIISASEDLLIQPRLHVFVGSQSELSLYSSQLRIAGESYFINMAVEASVEEEAHLKFHQTVMDDAEASWHFEAFRATLKRNSTLKTIAATNGSSALRNDYRVALAGENGEVNLSGIAMLKGKNEAHTHVVVDHQAPFCRSMQLFKNALSDTSHSSFEGKILVRQPAQKTEAFQLNNNLLLSDNAAADSKPNLEIFADDVKASHGATVGQLDKENLFYMQTRGFSCEEAKSLLVASFCNEVVESIALPSLKEGLITYSRGYLTTGN